MLLYQLIAQDVPIVAPQDSVDYISSLFFASQQAQLPVVDQGDYKGLIESKNWGQCESDPELFGPQLYEHFRPVIGIHAHPYEALRLMHHNALSVLPVLNDEREYVGVITKEALLNYLIDHINIDVAGGIILLEMEPRNYSLAQIARICENEQVLILAAHAKTNPSTAKLEVTIKTNSTDLSAVIQAFERYEYTVLDTYGDQKLDNDISDRYKLLMNFINM